MNKNLGDISNSIITAEEFDRLEIPEYCFANQCKQNVIKLKDNFCYSDLNMDKYGLIITEYSSYYYYPPTAFTGKILNPVDVVLQTGLCPELGDVSNFDSPLSQNIFIINKGVRVFMFIPREYFEHRLFEYESKKIIGYLNFLIMKMEKAGVKSCFISCPTVYSGDNAYSINDSGIQADTYHLPTHREIPYINLGCTKGTKYEAVLGSFYYNKNEFCLCRDELKRPTIKLRRTPVCRENVWTDPCKLKGIKSLQYALPDKDIVKLRAPKSLTDYSNMFFDYISNSWVSGKVIAEDEDTVTLESVGCAYTDFVYRCATIIDEHIINGTMYKTFDKFISRFTIYGTVYYINLKDAPYPDNMYDKVMGQYEGYYRKYYMSPSSSMVKFDMQRTSEHEAYIYVEVRDTGD